MVITFYTSSNYNYIVIISTKCQSGTNFYLSSSIMKRIKAISEKIIVYLFFPILYFIFLGLSKALYKIHKYFSREKFVNKSFYKEGEKISENLKDYEESF